MVDGVVDVREIGEDGGGLGEGRVEGCPSFKEGFAGTSERGEEGKGADHMWAEASKPV